MGILIALEKEKMKDKREELCLTFLSSIHHEARSSQAQLYIQASNPNYSRG